MDFINWAVNFILHLDTSLGAIISTYGELTYLILFAVIFCETGLVVTPFLPGDSVLFAVGAFCAIGSLNIVLALIILTAAAVLGDTVNYWIGKSLRNALKDNKRLRFIKREHLTKTSDFFDRHGGKTIILARFIPIIRTFAPFAAGAGKMSYKHFFGFNVIGGLLWVFLVTFAGYFFGGLPFIRDNFSVVIIAIVIISVLPMIISNIISRINKNK